MEIYFLASRCRGDRAGQFGATYQKNFRAETVRACTLVAYIVSTVRNTAINHLRKAGRIKLAETDIDDQSETIDPQLSLDDLLILRERQQKLAATWLNIPEDDRMLLEGKYLLGLSDGALAELAGCKSNSVRMKLTRARRNALKVMLDKEVEWI